MAPPVKRTIPNPLLPYLRALGISPAVLARLLREPLISPESLREAERIIAALSKQ